MIIGIAVPIGVVRTAAKEIFVPTIIVGIVVLTMIVVDVVDIVVVVLIVVAVLILRIHPSFSRGTRSEASGTKILPAFYLGNL